MRRFTARVAVAAALVALGLAWASPSASAHALLASSQPAAGSTVATSPAQILLTFTERPDPRLSSVHVLDPSGRSVEGGPAEPLALQPESLAVPVPSLAKGVYTVTWRVMSVVDGHGSAGSFSFGVGVAAVATTAQQSAEPKASSPTAAGIIGRWSLYCGLALLAGSTTVGLMVTRPLARRLSIIAPAVLAWAGLVVMILDQRAVARVGLGALLASRTGANVRAELIAMGVLTAAVLAWAVLRSRLASIFVGVAAVGTMVARSAAGHAGGSTHPAITVGVQSLHFAAAGAWVGGLPYLLVALRRVEKDELGRVARRFSTFATVGLGVVVITGVLRALDEVGAWSRFTSTAFGQALLVKLFLVAVVVALATLNRIRNVPRAQSAGIADALRRTTRVEIIAGTAVLAATAVLTGLPPARSVANTRPPARPAAVVAEGHDFGTTTRVRLVVTPGTAGPNGFQVTVVDYDTGQPVDARAVSLRFQYLDRADVPPSNLALTASGSGVWVADGTNVSLEGRWRVSALIEGRTGGFEVPMSFVTRTAPQSITTQRTPGLPTIYTVTGSGLQTQVYLDPGRAGFNELHVTYLASSGEELHVVSFAVTASGPGLSASQSLTARTLDGLGHFVADLEARSGRYEFTLQATLHDGRSIRAVVSIEVP